MTEWCEILDEPTFDSRVLHASTPVIVAFETDDCSYCRQQRELLSVAWRQLNWSAPTLRVDAFRLPAVAAAHRIVAYPTIAVFLDGRVAKRYPGRRDAADVTRRLGSLLGGPGLRTELNRPRPPCAAAISTWVPSLGPIQQPGRAHDHHHPPQRSHTQGRGIR